MKSISIPMPTRFAADCLMTLLYHLDRAYNIIISAENIVIEGPQPFEALREAVVTAQQILIRRSQSDERYWSRIPSSGNDNKILTKLYKALQLPKDSLTLDLVRVLAKRPVDFTQEIMFPSILKPEFYEYNRSAGYADDGVRKMGRTYPAYLVGLCLIGYLLSKIGYCWLERGVRVAVLMTPLTTSSPRPFSVDPEYRLATFLDPVGRLEDTLHSQRQGYRLDGLFPETALHLWLASRAGGMRIKLYAVNEPGRNNPATFFTSFQMNLTTVYEAMTRTGLTSEYMKDRVASLAGRALDTLRKDLDRTLAIRFSTLLFEALLGTRPLEDFVYASNRELLPYLLKGSEKDSSYYVAYDAVSIGRTLLRRTMV
ncbi:MAG: hypothetical protein NZ581_04255 [Candidatus Caldarchaeum sp.]|nr:hypothetical protein [Candidatus Caldarchaeum sp.]MDW8435393.1 hypothetical protein [Candidatus Caldarchaeum sp.]